MKHPKQTSIEGFTLESIGERRVSLYSNVRDSTGKSVALDEILEGVRYGFWAKQIAEIRLVDKDETDGLKKRLPCFTAAGTFHKRSKDGLDVSSGLLVADIDHLPSKADAENLRSTLGKDRHVLASFVSPSGVGVKAVFYVGHVADDGEAKAAYRALSDYLAKTYQVEMDPSGKDICRLCFVSHDEGAIVNTGEVQAFTARVDAPKPKASPTPAPSAGASHRASHDEDKAEEVRSAVAVLDAGCSRADWFNIGCAVKNALGDAGFSVFNSWSAACPEKYDQKETRKLWDSISGNGAITGATLFKMAADRGWLNPRGRHEQPSQSVSVDSVLETVASIQEEEPDKPKAKPKPWAGITDKMVMEAIDGTPLEKMVKVLAAVTNPPLPIQLTLPKAIALAGCALSQPVEFDPDRETRRGIELARLTINTSGGQLCNIWTCIVAPSASGKDIGNLPTRIANLHGVALGHAGSAEGLADAYRKNGAGLLTISELGPYLDPKSWQYKSTGFLTSVFNQHSAQIVLSKRNGESRDIPYCAPNIIANIQPNVLASMADALLMDSGHLPRYLFSYLPLNREWWPSTERLDLSPLSGAFQTYLAAEGQVNIPAKYLIDVYREFTANDAPLPAHWGRLIKEYGPRIAVMLAVSPSNTRNVVISDDHWRRTGILLRWFFSMAEQVLVSIGEPEHVRKMEDRLERMREWIGRQPKGVLKSVFSKRFFERGTTAFDRDRDLNELEARGLIVQQAQGKGTLLRAIK